MGVIMDLRDRKSLREGESSNSSNETENKKACTGCKTTKTPLWRGGPAGPKSLCNACGIRFRKKRRTEGGLEKGPEKRKGKTQITSDNTTTTTTTSTTISTSTSSAAATAKSPAKVATDNGLISENLRMSLMVLGKEMMLQRSFLVKKQRCQRKRKLGEEEQAAFSLMALSCGSVFA